MRLDQLIAAVEVLQAVGRTDVEVERLTLDSRRAGPGALFFAVPGTRTDGNRFARDAAAQGAAGVVSELDPPPAPYAFPCPWIQVADIHRAMAAFATVFHGDPSKDLRVVGVTGTNGKTTVCWFLESVFERAGIPAGVLGTVGYRFRGETFAEAVNTTPLALELQATLAGLKERGARAVAMEVSSHALALERVRGVTFDVAVFTNLTRDHMDFHGTREGYLGAKRKLFERLSRSPGDKAARRAVINADDPAAEEFAAAVEDPVGVVRYGLGENADLRAKVLAAGVDGTRFHVRAADWEGTLRTRLVGAFNVSNALAAFGAARALGLAPESAAAGIEALERVPGRLEAVDAGQDFTVFVDYAHTDDALASVLRELKKLARGRIITVFGCGGDRDRGKRGPMGVAACRGSDEAVLTNDNPRGEDPELIAADVEEGLRAAGLTNYSVELDRSAAIAKAIGKAGPGDVVLIAGKGHEDYQILAGGKIRFDDREHARAALGGRA